ncbi:hypothetical protein [Methylobacterium radiodurans]|uniref:Uncharacterized protein n=1 Tax=Methylobacterium radiodurans TaxID=2202828 RepID=A0A2U8VWU6_9HYPH|nr:hypothetical protein [Methylobacterium radiodurans]AWN37771.1 hypothetical protein DK427_20245 [Methylobacterium radiodurans]
MADPRFASPSWPLRPGAGSRAPRELDDLLAHARTHDAVAECLADKAFRLDPSGSSPVLRPLRRMVRDHRIRALLLRGRAACIRSDDPPGTPS